MQCCLVVAIKITPWWLSEPNRLYLSHKKHYNAGQCAFYSVNLLWPDTICNHLETPLPHNLHFDIHFAFRLNLCCWNSICCFSLITDRTSHIVQRMFATNSILWRFEGVWCAVKCITKQSSLQYYTGQNPNAPQWQTIKSKEIHSPKDPMQMYALPKGIPVKVLST